jgi:hypothetical protein
MQDPVEKVVPVLLSTGWDMLCRQSKRRSVRYIWTSDGGIVVLMCCWVEKNTEARDPGTWLVARRSLSRRSVTDECFG